MSLDQIKDQYNLLKTKNNNSMPQDIEKTNHEKIIQNKTNSPAENTYKFYPAEIDHLLQIIGYQIDDTVLWWCKTGGLMTEDESLEFVEISKLNRLLLILNKLLPYHLENAQPIKHKESPNDGYYTDNEVALFRQLSKIKKRMTFPPIVEKYYQAMEEWDIKKHTASSVCVVCGKKNAIYVLDSGFETEDFVAHTYCLVDRGWYKCNMCHWAYPEKKPQGCQRELWCKDGELEQFTVTDLHSGIS